MVVVIDLRHLHPEPLDRPPLDSCTAHVTRQLPAGDREQPCALLLALQAAEPLPRAERQRERLSGQLECGLPVPGASREKDQHVLALTPVELSEGIGIPHHLRVPRARIL
jgi:hypothetical protein